MTTNRYDRLSELDTDHGAPHGDGNIFTDETWVQAPDGSWLRSTDKAAQKLIRKGKVKVSAPTQPPIPPQSTPSQPAPPPAPAAPKRRLSRKEERERDAELARQAERERQEREERRVRERKLELERQAELERERQAELERQHQAELDRKAELERQGREMARQAELERARAAELEQQIERERMRVAELERQVEEERQRKASAKSAKASRASAAASSPAEVGAPPSKLDDTGAYFREPGQYTTHWPEDRPVSAPPLASPPAAGQPGKHAPKGKSKPKQEPKPKAQAKIRPARGRVSTGARIANGAMTLGLVAATLLLGAAINWLGPDAAHALRPFTQSGAPGKTVDARAFTVTVHAAKAASALQVAKGAIPTQGAWVIVHVSVAATKEPTHIGYAALRDKSGRTFLATDRIVQPLLDGTRTLQPGIGLQGDVVFEVPKDALADLTALFAAQPDHLGMDALASVDLPPLTLAGDAPAALAATEVKP